MNRNHPIIIICLTIFLAGCTPLFTSEPAQPVEIGGATSITPQSLPLGFASPNWEELELPADCDARILSQDLQWVMLVCQTGPEMFETWSASIQNSRIAKKNLIEFDANVRGFAFSHDNSSLIQMFNDRWEKINLGDKGYSNEYPEIQVFPSQDSGYAGAWSPNGSMFAEYAENCDGIVIRTSENPMGKVIRKEPCDRFSTLFSWSPDSSQIVYIDGARLAEQGLMQVYTVDVNSLEKQLIYEGDLISGASWSPDGKWILVREENFETSAEAPPKTFLSLLNPSEQNESLIRYEFQLQGKDSIYDGWGDLLWSPDSSKVAFYGYSRDTGISLWVIGIPDGSIIHQERTKGFSLYGWDEDSSAILIAEAQTDAPDVLKFIEIP